MNIFQKLCITAGAAVIAVILIAYPVTKNIEVEKSVGIGDWKTTKTITVIDYKATGLKVGGVASATLGLTVLLGLIKTKREVKNE